MGHGGDLHADRRDRLDFCCGDLLAAAADDGHVASHQHSIAAAGAEHLDTERHSDPDSG
jgi:hypothetical protein